MKKAHNISKTTTKKEFKKMSTNNDKDIGLEIILGMKSTVNFDTYI